MNYVRIKNGIVVEVIDVGVNNIKDMFTEDIVATCVADPSGSVSYGCSWDGTVFGPVKTTELTWDTIRLIRNDKLSKSDWRMVEDAPATIKSHEWKIYRQALRDITTQSDPSDITWPTEPK